MLRLLCLAVLLFSGISWADDAKTIFDRHRSNVVQVLIIEAASDKKSAIGSGFRFGTEGMVATNFHVISEAVHAPEKYRVELLLDSGDRIGAQIEHFDVIHDLALLSTESDFAVGQLPFTMSERTLTKGETVYSLGNPYDLGQTIIPGTFNGVLETSFYQKLLFSGSLNPGMSGGPSVDDQGNVVGVNVATSGNQISFLVPAKYLLALISRRELSTRLSEADYPLEIGRQLVADQDFKYALLLNLEWPTQTLGEARVGGEISDYFKCWGDTQDDDDLLYTLTDTNCSSQDSIYISSHFQTGAIDYQYSWVQSDELDELRFTSFLSRSMGMMYTRNPASEDDATNYQCRQAFVGERDEQQGKWRTVFCVRQYLEYPELYDVLYLGALTGRPGRGLTSHFALSGVTQANAQAFLRKFIGLQSWDS